MISIHSLVKRETHKIHCDREKTKYFNPLPRKEEDGMSALIGYLPEHFNPLPRKEGDVVQYTYCEDGIDISIHSLVKRETGRKFAVDAMDDGISIHSLVKRETQSAKSS